MTREFFFVARSSLIAASAILLLACQRGPTRAETSVTLQLALESGDVKVVTVSLGDGLPEIMDRLRPATFHVDDDPLLLYRGADGGHYMLYFSTSGTDELHQYFDDKLYGVARFGPDLEDGAFLLPVRLYGRPCPESYLEAKEILG